MYSCELCSWKAASAKLINQHYRQTHAREFMPVEVQSKSTVTKKHACPYCDYRSNLIGHVKRHILIHTGETPLECTHCEYKCRDSTVLKRHIERHFRDEPKQKKCNSEGEKYLCDKCAFATVFKGAFTRHLLRHNEPKICRHCSQRFWKEKSYANHILLHVGVALHQCKSCDYKTNVTGDLRDHVRRMHADAKSWKCTECNYATKCPSDLSKHKTIHKTERPFACDKCEYTCKRRSHLTVHSATHNPTLKNYSCPFCDFRTVHISTLKIHVRSHTGEKPYNCDICGAAYTSAGGAQAHAYSHLKNWSQTCPFCDFTASKPHLFKAHIKTHSIKPIAPGENKSPLSPKHQQQSSDKNCPSPTPEQIPGKSTTLKQNRTGSSLVPPSFKEEIFYEKALLEPPSSLDLEIIKSLDLEIIKAYPDETFMKMEPVFLPPALTEFDEAMKIEDTDILNPVKQEYIP